MQGTLKPALIIGSGFHRHVFSSGSAEPSQDRACLFDWHKLIEKTADQMQVARPNRVLNPTMRWEALIGAAGRDGYMGPNQKWRLSSEVPANVIETHARRHVALALTAASQSYPQSRRAQIPAQSGWGCVVSLNFDLSWHPLYTALPLPKLDQGTMRYMDGRASTRESQRLFASLPPTVGVPRTWFPNGSILEPRSIRMGLRDYGAAAPAIHQVFRSLKIWERESLEPNALRLGGGFDKIADILEDRCDPEMDKAAQKLPRSWVTDFLYRPLIFVGVGLSEQEAGLWWLLTQRARNLARVSHRENSSVRVLVRRDERTDFWAARPFGIEPVFCDNWDRGWEEILA